MSDAAERDVETYTHPKVKGSVRDLLRSIARRIPEGQTTTPPLTLDDLATATEWTERTMRTARDILEAVGKVKVHDGGRGRKDARYELLGIDGARPVTPVPLPLRADLREARRPDPDADAVADLFTEAAPKVGSDVGKVGKFSSEVRQKVGKFFRRCGAWLVKVGSDLQKVGKFFRPLLPLDGTRARATYNNLRTTTTAPIVAASAPTSRPPRCRWLGSSHAWCEGRVHVPMPFHLEERRKLARLPGQTDADLDAELFALYGTVLAGIPDSTPITDRNEFAFWNRVLRGATPARRTWIPFRRPPPRGRHEGVPSGTGTCPHTPRCESAAGVSAWVVCRDRSLADAKAERERKSG